MYHHVWDKQAKLVTEQMFSSHNNEKREYAKISRNLKNVYIFGGMIDRQTDNKCIKCEYVIGIFTKSFSCLSLIESRKITFPY